MLRTTVLCIALLQGTVGASAQRAPLPTEAGLMEITNRGRMLVEYDTASWHSTDAVLALKPEEGKVRRYVARKVDSKWVVVFGRLNEAWDKFLIAHEAAEGDAPQQFIGHGSDFFLFYVDKAHELQSQSPSPRINFQLPYFNTIIAAETWTLKIRRNGPV